MCGGFGPNADEVRRRRVVFFFSSRRRHTRCSRDWSSDVCSSDLSASSTSGNGRALRVPARRAGGTSYDRAMVRVLAVSDEVDDALVADPTAVRGAQLILACGDLPFEYLGSLMNALDVPLVFVPGNHDPDVSGYRSSRAGLTLKAGLPTRPPWPDGAVNADGRIIDVAGLRLAGLGGCRRYSDGPNQYTDRQQTRRARALRGRAWWRRQRDSRGGDVLLTPAPPRGRGGRGGPPH